MSNERAGLGFDDDDIDIADLVDVHEEPKTIVSPEVLKKNLTKESAKYGFVSREVPRRRRVSPYTAQFGGKCREGMKPLFKEIGERLDCYDTETLERAILALLEKEGLSDLLERYNQITDR